MSGAPVLDFALHALTTARATMYGAVLAASGFAPAREDLSTAVDGIRKSGRMEFLPAGLLTRAWLRFLEGDLSGCQADLDEAWDLAERGPMPLFQADIQLTRARLFRDPAALVAARDLIQRHGYHRRDEELADAESALTHAP